MVLERPRVAVRERRQIRLAWVARHSIAIALAVMFITPVAYLVLLSLMTSNQALTSDYWPNTWHPENYVKVFEATPLPHYLLNTVLYAVTATVLTLASSVPAAYALAKLRFRGRNALFLVVICVMMLPPQVVTVPLYLMWARYGLTGSLAPLIIPALFGDAFCIFLLRQFLLTIPGEYLDAARVDGCGEWRTLLRVVLPMARPGIAAAGLFQFFFCWNDYYGPLLYTSENENSWTLTLGLASFRTVHHIDWNLVTAATVLAMAPLIIIFFFAQRAFVQGITLTGFKG
ncbi:carbohydrate ABC transporter permease [Actinoplanes regularis]|uniref:Multiple sugar transport system permease protein n=1 Tax=Actinoplanes regularis TaxID=52697 RepID=A0A238YNZ1_9ACTN|nr:carbohydrate ABC transporter permease [Actinoplanes regularis]GIE85433.1 sugar ABC transporter permease [Actinoplanes regularis]GLW29055.1 sugar ABC transporter permease [Actinoplanes regularis]SNR72722.1 multiple sugar transport system permease protein [Actinoplanes regularis]